MSEHETTLINLKECTRKTIHETSLKLLYKHVPPYKNNYVDNTKN